MKCIFNIFYVVLIFLFGCAGHGTVQYSPISKSFADVYFDQKFNSKVLVLPYKSESLLSTTTTFGSYTHTVLYDKLLYALTKKTVSGFLESGLFSEAEEGWCDLDRLRADGVNDNSYDLIFVGTIKDLFKITTKSNSEEMVNLKISYEIYDKNGFMIETKTINQSMSLKDHCSFPKNNSILSLEDQYVYTLFDSLATSPALNEWIVNNSRHSKKIIKNTFLKENTSYLSVEFNGFGIVSLQKGMIFKEIFNFDDTKIPVQVYIDGNLFATENAVFQGETLLSSEDIGDLFYKKCNFVKMYKVRPGQHLLKVVFDSSYNLNNFLYKNINSEYFNSPDYYFERLQKFSLDHVFLIKPSETKKIKVEYLFHKKNEMNVFGVNNHVYTELN